MKRLQRQMFDPTKPSKSHVAEKLSVVCGTSLACQTETLNRAIVKVIKQQRKSLSGCVYTPLRKRSPQKNDRRSRGPTRYLLARPPTDADEKETGNLRIDLGTFHNCVTQAGTTMRAYGLTGNGLPGMGTR
jgi:hypothetical protein